MEITPENRKFLTDLGMQIKDYAKKFPLPAEYEFLQKLSPEECGLFIAEMFVDRQLDLEYPPNQRRVRHPAAFEGSLLDSNKYLQSCVDGFLSAMKEISLKNKELSVEKIINIHNNNNLLNLGILGRLKNFFFPKSVDNIFDLAKNPIVYCERTSFGAFFTNDRYSVSEMEKAINVQAREFVGSDDLVEGGRLGFVINEFGKNVYKIGTKVDYYKSELNEVSRELLVNYKHSLVRKETTIKNDISNVVRRYNFEIKKAETEKEKLHAIFNCVSWIQNLHMFSNGNGRLSVNLLNALLAENNLKPCILKNINSFCLEYPILRELERDAALDMYYEGARYFEDFQKSCTTQPKNVSLPNVKQEECFSKFNPSPFKANIQENFTLPSLKVVKNNLTFK